MTMKKTISVLLTLCLLVGMLAIPARVADAAETATVEYVRNGGFETYTGNTPADWTATAGQYGTDFTISGDGGRSGGSALVMTNTGSNIYVTQRNDVSTPGGEYTFSAWVKAGAVAPGNDYARINFEYRTAEGTTLSGAKTIRLRFTDQEWTQVTETFSIPETAASVAIQLRNVGSSGTQAHGTVFWDDISFTEEVASTPEPEPEPEPEPVPLIESLVNGGFETHTEGTPASWGKSTNAEFGTDISIMTDEATVHEGSAALRMTSTGSSIWVNQRNSGYVPGGEYIFSAWVKAGNPAPAANVVRVKFEFQNAAGQTATEGGAGDITINPVLNGTQWTKVTQTITLPETATRVNVLLRLTNSGTVYWDEVSLGSEETEVVVPELPPVALPPERLKAPYPGTSNLLANSSFEAVNGELPANWQNTANRAVIDSTTKANGNNSVKISTTSGGSPWIRQIIEIEPNTEYQVRAWIRQEGIKANSRDAMFKMEYFTGPTGAGYAEWIEAARVSEGLAPTERQWTQVEQVFTTPHDARFLTLYGRLHASTGTIWFDDFELYQTGAVPRIIIETDDIFYYEDRETGTARTDLTMDFQHLNGGTIDFKLKDGETVLQEQTGSRMNSDGSAFFKYDLSLLTETKKAYYVEATLKDEDGASLESIETDIYRYNRPTVLTDEGLYMIDDEVFVPTVVYHPNRSTYDVAEEMGVTLVQITYGVLEEWAKGNEAPLRDTLDDIAARGLKGILCLYTGMKAASHPDNIDVTIDVVTTFKNHPAIFGYAVIDEPFSQIPNPEQFLKESYKTIRNIDDKHPVYLLDANDYEFNLAAKFADVFVHDPYPTSSNEAGSYVQNLSDVARMATARNNKPFLTVNQAFTYSGYTPTAEDLRNMWYQALLGGSKGNGYYSLPLMRALPGVEDGVKQFAQAEQELSYDLFAYGGHAAFNAYKEEGYLYSSVVKGDDVYMIILNRNTTPRTVPVSLVSHNGKVSIAEGTVEALYGGTDTNHTVDGDKMTVTLGSRQAALFKISGVTIDGEELAASAFDDLSEHAWAEKHIDALFAQGILNAASAGKFEPDQDMSRADFVVALLNALDIQIGDKHIKWGKNNLWGKFVPYADIDASEPYARSIAVGKYYGLLEDVIEGNSFEPEASFSKQDMILISARALSLQMILGGDADLSELEAFSDSSSIADYAALAIAQMVKNGYVTASGAMEPLKNVTRAESAVWLSKLMDPLAEDPPTEEEPGTETPGTGTPGTGTPGTAEPGQQSVVSSGSTSLNVNVQVDKERRAATVKLDSAAMSALLKNNKGKKVSITLPEMDEATSYHAEIPIGGLLEQDNELELRTPAGTVNMSQRMLKELADVHSLEGNVTFTVGQGDRSALPGGMASTIGNRPVIEVGIAAHGGSVAWSNEDAPVIVRIPYAPTASEKSSHEHLVVWQISADGNAVPITGGKYDPSSGTVTFATTHSGLFGVGYVHKTFSDLERAPWARHAIEVLASKGIINGTSASGYSPHATIKRADYIVLLIKTLGLYGKSEDTNFDDVKPTDYYYEALSVARKLGIATGVGNNRFNPEGEISREDMIVLTARALAVHKGLSLNASAGALDGYDDRDAIADYAVTAMATLVREGLIQGTGTSLQAKASTNRAQAAMFLYRIYNKY